MRFAALPITVVLTIPTNQVFYVASAFAEAALDVSRIQALDGLGCSVISTHKTLVALGSLTLFIVMVSPPRAWVLVHGEQGQKPW